jgi:RNA polymerase sigma factor (TIGR02999 family)
MQDDNTALCQTPGGGRADAESLLPLVYNELRQLASRELAQEKPGQTLSPTALVHEAYLRLVANGDMSQWEGRRHFFGAAAEAMRRILIESARRKRTKKRGGEMTRSAVCCDQLPGQDAEVDLVGLDYALQKLSLTDPVAAELVNLRYFAGLTLGEAAQLLEMAPRSVDRLWAYARAWLRREMASS